MKLHMRGNTPWNFPNSARRGLPMGQNVVVPGQSWQNQPRQSRGGKNILDRTGHGQQEYVHGTWVDPSIVTRGVVPYYDPTAAPLFVARFGSGNGKFPQKKDVALIPPVVKRVAPFVGRVLLVAGGMGLATYALGSAAIGSGNEFAGGIFGLMLAFDAVALVIFFPGAVYALGVLIEGKDGG